MNWKKILVICLSLLILPTAALATYDPTNLNNTAIRYYEAEAASGNLIDSTGNSNGVATGISYHETGKIAYGVGFDGSNADKVVVGGYPLTAQSVFSTCTWVYAEGSKKWSNVWRGQSGGTSIALQTTGDAGAPYSDTFRYSFYQSGTKFDAVGGTVNYDQWDHICTVNDGSDASVYQNGVLVDSDGTSAGSVGSWTYPVTLGLRPDNNAEKFEGRLDEIAFFDAYALNQTDIDFLYALGSPASGQQYPFSVVPPNVDPTITNITNQVILEDTPTTFNSLFTINDTDGDISSLVLTYASSNTSIIAASGGVTFATSDTTGVTNVTITPEGDAYGILTLTITVTDVPGGSALDSFKLTVTNVNDGPTISAINDVNTLAGDTVINPFTVLDIDNDYTDLTYSASSDNAPLFTSSTFSNSDSTNQNFTIVLATYGQAIVNVTVSDLEPLSDSTTFSVYAYCNTSSAPYTDTNAVDAPPSCYDVSGSFDEETDMFTYTWFDFGNTTENNYVEVYRTSAGSWDLVASPASTNNSGSFEINLSAYPHDNFQIRGFMTDTTRTFIDGESSQRVYMDNINQQLNLPQYWKQSDGIIWSVLIITLFLTIGIASQSATLTLILSIFGLFFATNMVLNVPAQFLWTAGVVVAILIGIIAKLRID